MGFLRYVLLVTFGLVLFGLKTSVSQPQQQSQVPCLFIFGDSLVDNGNNNRFNFALSLYMFYDEIFFPHLCVTQVHYNLNIHVGCFLLRGLIIVLMESTFPKVLQDGSPTVVPTLTHLVISVHLCYPCSVYNLIFVLSACINNFLLVLICSSNSWISDLHSSIFQGSWPGSVKRCEFRIWCSRH